MGFLDFLKRRWQQLPQELPEGEEPLGLPEGNVIEGEYTELPDDGASGQQQSTSQQGTPFSSTTQTGSDSESEGEAVRIHQQRLREQQESLRRAEEGKKKKKETLDKRESKEEELRRKELLRRRKLEELEYREARAEREASIRKAGGTGYQKFARTFGETRKIAGGVSGALVKVGTLGGPVKMDKKRASLYLGDAPKAAYDVTGMRELTKLGGGEEAGGQSDLRRLTSLGTPIKRPLTRLPVAKMITPGSALFMAQVPQEGAMARLRELIVPKGLTPIERMAYHSVIRSGDDIDTKSKVISELEQLGVSRVDAMRAIDSLLGRGVLQRTPENTLEVR